MNHLTKIYIVSFLIAVCSVLSCVSDDPNNLSSDNFERKPMLEFWADDIIIPVFDQYIVDLESLDNAREIFIADPSVNNLNVFQDAWLTAYHTWQGVALFNIGKAEEIGLINFTNIYPTDVELIEENIENQNYNFMLPSNFDVQGFPALDYLLYGVGNSKEETVDVLRQEKYSIYLTDLTATLLSLSKEVQSDWNSGYREIFVENDGSSASSSVDKLVNDFLFHYEKYFRAGKIGIPAGIFSGSPMSNSVEAPYSNVYSKELFSSALTSIEGFFLGESYLNKSITGPSINSYLKHAAEFNEDSNVSQSVVSQWSLVSQELSKLPDSFKDQIESDNSKILQLYDEVQKAVVFLKVDMMQALNIQVDYVDADGD